MGGEIKHDPQADIDKSIEESKAPWWIDIYRKLFPDLKDMVYVGHDGWAQRQGIDRIVFLNTGRIYYINEKVRYKDYGDILIEFISNSKEMTSGWAEKDLICDFILYVVLPSKKALLIPYQSFKRLWKKYRDLWIEKYRSSSPNEGYDTLNVHVPKEEFFTALREAIAVKWV